MHNFKNSFQTIEKNSLVMSVKQKLDATNGVAPQCPKLQLVNSRVDATRVV